MSFKIIKYDVNEKVVCRTKLEKDCWLYCTYLSIRSSNVTYRLNVGLSRGSKKRGFISAPETYHTVSNDKN